MTGYSWSCPFCKHDATVTEENSRNEVTDFTIENSVGYRRINTVFIVCPNPKCRKFTLESRLFELFKIKGSGWIEGDLIRKWHLIPPTQGKNFPDYVPKSITDDFYEAWLIVDLSPKASATISRQCLSKILQDFWKVKPANLAEEFNQLKDKVDHLTWQTIESVRHINNIGSHMTRNVNVIQNADPGEAELLLGLADTLIKNWYIASAEKKSRLKKIIQLGKAKSREPSSV